MLHKYLLDEPPLVVLPSLAKRIGLNEAIVIQQVHYWLTNAREAKRAYNFRQGRWWVYHSYAEWRLTFPFWSEPTIKRTFLGLEKTGIIVSACLGDDPRDRSKWYSIDYDALAQLLQQGKAEADCPLDQFDPMDNITMIPSTGSMRSNASAEDELVQGIHSIRCLTGADTTADTTTDTTTDRHLVKGGQPGPHFAAAAVAALDNQEVSLPMQVTCPDVELVQALIANDVNRADAERLASSVPEECRRQLEFLALHRGVPQRQRRVPAQRHRSRLRGARGLSRSAATVPEDTEARPDSAEPHGNRAPEAGPPRTCALPGPGGSVGVGSHPE